MKEKNVIFSIDKLCVLGKVKKLSYVYLIIDYAKYNMSFFEKINISKDFYSNSYTIVDLGFLQVDTATCNFRLEFNPNKLTKNSNLILNELLTYVTDYHFSRIDLAIDLYNYDLYNYNIVDLGRRKKAYYYDTIGKLETCYFGSMSSNKFIRIYNKAKEQKLDNKDWWRVELQLRDTYIDTYLTGLNDYLKDVCIFKYSSLDEFNFTDKAIIQYLLQDISRFSYLSKNSRTKYRKILVNLEMESLDFINDFMQCSYVEVLDYLRKLCPTIYL